MTKPVVASAARKKTAADRRLQPRRGTKERRLPDFRDLADNAVQGIVVHLNFKPLYANAAFAQLLGYAGPEDILALPLLRPLVPADIWGRAEQDYDDLIKRRQTAIVGRLRAVRKDGREIWLAITQRVTDWHGTPVVAVSALDITAQVLAEEALLHSEHHLRAVLEILPYPIYIAGRADGQLLFVNRKTCLLFQSSARQLLKGNSADFYVDAREREDLRQLLTELPDIRDVETHMKTAAGRPFTAELAAIRMDYAGTPAILVALNDISQRKEMEAELFRQASTDPLTGVSNRRYFMAQAEQELRRSRRFARRLSVMMIDVDHFKQVNDTHGHATGDGVLQAIVHHALDSLRQSDLLGRFGGEEFAVILPETELAAAVEVAERLRHAIAARPLVVDAGQKKGAIPSTVSVGVAQLRAGDATVDALLQRADAALYAAKHNGRNRVEVAG